MAPAQFGSCLIYGRSSRCFISFLFLLHLRLMQWFFTHIIPILSTSFHFIHILDDHSDINIPQYFTFTHCYEKRMESFVIYNRARDTISSAKFHFFHCLLPIVSTSFILLSPPTTMLSCVLSQSVCLKAQESGLRCLQEACQLEIPDYAYSLCIQTSPLVSMYIAKFNELLILSVLKWWDYEVLSWPPAAFPAFL